ncbi:DUF192 domain-containing protein [Shimia sediminis]|uniref:DUF192 domain-containing protein n=1 Tax=Shimia sediminis TaxID=2497945 RepID=UPI000F8F5B59|nr:DUF192 domain-containing protein [Shimia sediminis]
MSRIVLVGALCALGVSGMALADPACREDTVHLRGDWGQAVFRVEVADTEEERAQGLMHRDSLSPSAGMLFVFQKTGPVSFWMENTLIPLDMLFVDETGQVTHIHPEAQPLDRTAIHSQGDVRYVLEIKGGLARAMGIVPGSALRHPSILQDGAVWSCEGGS